MDKQKLKTNMKPIKEEHQGVEYYVCSNCINDDDICYVYIDNNWKYCPQCGEKIEW